MTDPGSSEDTKQDKCKNKQTNIKTPKLIIFKLHKINFFFSAKKARKWTVGNFLHIEQKR